MNERLRELEIKITFLEKHIEEQDRAMLENYRSIETLRREVRRLSEAVAQNADKSGATGGAENGARGTEFGASFGSAFGSALDASLNEEPFPANEKPPHY
ncbi:MAG: SlyX family protein [Puniceicoccales bacterium]|jgi:uncharacterized coiled-coil protein SlyX|nr:SlyX family protein [Puniceicoccales bacterium]